MNIYKFEEDRDRYKDRKWAGASVAAHTTDEAWGILQKKYGNIAHGYISNVSIGSDSLKVGVVSVTTKDVKYTTSIFQDAEEKKPELTVSGEFMWTRAAPSTVDIPCLQLEIGGRILYRVNRSRETLKWEAFWSLFPLISCNTLVKDATLEESKAACIKHYQEIGHTALEDY